MNRITVAAITWLACSLASIAAAASPLRADHPLLGTWQITLPNTCTETLAIQPSGRIDVTSGEEVSVSEADIADQPDDQGFIKWTDKIVEDNGRPDCTGSITPMGDISVTYIHLDAGGDRFALCFSHSTGDCVGPFIRRR